MDGVVIVFSPRAHDLSIFAQHTVQLRRAVHVHKQPNISPGELRRLSRQSPEMTKRDLRSAVFQPVAGRDKSRWGLLPWYVSGQLAL